MTKKILSAALLAAAAFGTGAAYAQSYDQNGYGYQTSPQQVDPSTSQYYNYQGERTTSPSSYQDQGSNGQYIDHSAPDMRANQPNNFARDLKDGPMGTSPGA